MHQVAVGDHVVLGYYSGIAAEVTDPESGESAGSVELGAARAEPGTRPGGIAGVSVSETVTIEGVDTRRNSVTFRGEDGLVRAVDVRRPEMQNFIKGLHKGDRVRLTYTEAVAVRVEPAS